MNPQEFLKLLIQQKRGVVSGNSVLTACPSCNKTNFVSGEKLMVFRINQVDGCGVCDICQKHIEFAEIIKELRIQDTIKPDPSQKSQKSEEKVSRSDSREPRISQSDLLVEAIENNPNIILFRNDFKEPFVRIPIGSHHEIWPCKSKSFKRWLATSLWDIHHKTPNSDSLNSALNVIEGKAYRGDGEYQLHNRVAWREGVLWYDLSDAEWQAVKITTEGWDVVSDTPILFRRYSHQRAQVRPAVNGDVKKLLQFVNVTSEHHQLLLLVYIISCFIPDFPHPIPLIYGAQGSAKSVLSKIIRRLIDPSDLEVISFPRESSQLAQQLSHHWCLFFDNVSELPEWLSDMLCRAVSGDGFSKRELYSDDDDIIYTFKRCIGINGINLVARKPDLLERSILLELERVSESGRLQEQELWKRFEEERSIILGGIFDVLSKAMSIKPTVHMQKSPRMADFASWGCAIAEALGYTQKQFLNAYYANIHGQNEEVLGGSLIATAIRKFMDDNTEWEGNSSELLRELASVAQFQGINPDKEKEWPKAANVLSRRLNELKTNLAEDGILIKFGYKQKQRMVTLQKCSGNVDAIVEPFHNELIPDGYSNDKGDDSSQQFLESSPEEQPALMEYNDGNDNNDELRGV